MAESHWIREPTREEEEGGNVRFVRRSEPDRGEVVEVAPGRAVEVEYIDDNSYRRAVTVSVTKLTDSGFEGEFFDTERGRHADVVVGYGNYGKPNIRITYRPLVYGEFFVTEGPCEETSGEAPQAGKKAVCKYNGDQFRSTTVAFTVTNVSSGAVLGVAEDPPANVRIYTAPVFKHWKPDEAPQNHTMIRLGPLTA